MLLNKVFYVVNLFFFLIYLNNFPIHIMFVTEILCFDWLYVTFNRLIIFKIFVQSTLI